MSTGFLLRGAAALLFAVALAPETAGAKTEARNPLGADVPDPR